VLRLAGIWLPVRWVGIIAVIIAAGMRPAHHALYVLQKGPAGLH
jgi:hypothetical protein